MDLKESYAINHSKQTKNTLLLNKRLFDTYNRISLRKCNLSLSGANIDLGSGDQGFSKYLRTISIESFPYDYPSFDIEKDSLDHEDQSIDFITMNAVIEHIKDPDNIFLEIKRVLKPAGLLYVRTPNWQMCHQDFYNDPTHVKPYSPQGLRHTFEFYDLNTLFIEPGLVEKGWFWWTLPDSIKWRISSYIAGGTKSIIGVAQNKEI